MNEQRQPLSEFGEDQIERIAQRKATQFNESIGKYPTLRYQVALLVAIANIMVFLAAVATAIFSFVEMSYLYSAIALIILSYLLRYFSEWLTPDAIDC